MIKKYILAGLLILFPVSAFADGGLPLWINTIQTELRGWGTRCQVP